NIDLTAERENWVKLGFAFASLGGNGRSYFHQISSLYPQYSEPECDKLFEDCLKRHDGSTNIGSFFYACKQAGVEIPESAFTKNIKILQNKTVTTAPVIAKHKILSVVKTRYGSIEQAKNKPTTTML